MTKRPLVAVYGVLAALAAAGLAVAATLGVTSATLTTYGAAASIPASTCTLTADADADVDEQFKTANNGALTTMSVEDRTNQRRRSFVHFDVASCLPAGALVVSATLSLHLATAPAPSRTYDAQRAAGAWTESVNWNSQPGVAGTAVGVATGTTDAVTLSWPVTTDVQLFANGTANDGWRIADAAEGANSRAVGTFRTREWGTAAERPTLSITYYP